MKHLNKKNDKLIEGDFIALGLLEFADTEQAFVMTEEVKAFIGEVLDSFDLKTDSRKLLDALLIISSGRIEFRASRKQIVNCFRFPNKSVKIHTKTDKIYDASKELIKWSQSNTELIKFIETKGRGRESEAIYDFVLLKKLKQFIQEYTDHNQITPTNIKKFVSMLKSSDKRGAVKSLSNHYFYQVS